jgi:hypothetical protein
MGRTEYCLLWQSRLFRQGFYGIQVSLEHTFVDAKDHWSASICGMRKCFFARPILHKHFVVGHCALWVAEALGAHGLKGQPTSTSLAVVNSGKYSTAQIRRGKVAPNGEVNAVHANLLDCLDVSFDYAIGRTEKRMEISIRISGGTQQVCLAGTARHRDSRGGHACSFS